MSGINKEVWTDQIMKGFYPTASFLNFAKDFTALVEFDKINLADAGVDPDVFINGNTYPIGIVEREDTPIAIELDLFETKNTVVRDARVVEVSYDKLESVVSQHRATLMAGAGKKAAHAFAPMSNTANTPILRTSGDDNGSGLKRLLPEDILDLATKFDDLDIEHEKRFFVLHQNHLNDLIRYDLKAFKDLTNFRDGKPNTFAGFNMLLYTKNAYYNATTLQKKAFQSTPGVNDTYCSFAFSSDEVMKADGDIKMYARENDPEHRGTIVGFDKRFVGMPIRNKGIGAVVTAKVA